MRKILLAVLVAAVAASGGVYWLSRRAPELLREAIGRSIHKTVRIDSIEYRFPGTFELKGFRILENRDPFVGETCFAVDKVELEVSPLSLSRKRLIIEQVDVRQALVVVRNRGGKLFHALSDAMTPPEAVSSAPSGEAPGQPESGIPLVIHRFYLDESRFQFIDYDVQASGFVSALEDIEADVKQIAFPPGPSKTSYNIEANLAQGRAQKPAAVQVSGWTVLGDYETDALIRASDVSLPYFKPYYAQVTPADIEEGRLSVRSALRIHDRLLTANADIEVSQLLFRDYEQNGELFGLKADEILAFLKDSAGRLKFQIVLQWEIGDRGTERRAVIRRAIEQSLKKTLIGNVGNILENTLRSFSEAEGEGGRGELDEALKKVKNLFR